MFKKCRQHFLVTCRARNIALQVATVCCEYYHLRAQQIFMLQKVEAASTFGKMKIVARGGGNTGNKQSQLSFNIYYATSCEASVAAVLLGLNSYKINYCSALFWDFGSFKCLNKRIQRNLANANSKLNTCCGNESNTRN